MAHAIVNLPDFILYNKPYISDGIFWRLILLFACVFIIGVCIIEKIN